MRSCDEILDLISAALDGALTSEEQAALDEHLSRCPACSALFAELNGLHTAAAGLEEASAPAGFAGQVMARIAADPVQAQSGNVAPFPKKKRSPWKGWAATAAVVAVVALGAVTLPGQFRSASKSTADCAAPATAESAADVEFSEASSALIPDEDNAANVAPRMDTGGAAPESENISIDSRDTAPDETSDGPKVDQQLAPAATQNADPQDTPSDVDNDKQPLDTAFPTAYCGVLTLTGEPLPEGLENYEATEDEQGNLTYIVPADYFFSCLSQPENQSVAGFTYEPSGEETAEYGLIIVAPSP